MARDDDDDVRDRDDDDDRPRKGDARDDDDDDRSSKKSADPVDDADDVAARPLPLRVIGAIIASIFWGGLMLHGSCMSFSHSSMMVIAFHRVEAAGFNIRGAGGGGEGFYGTLAATQFVMFLLGGGLLAGGVLLLLRKGYAKWMAMGVPAAMALLQMAACVLCLIITGGVFLAQHNFDFLINIVFNMAVGGANAYLLLNKDVAKVLK